MRWLSCESWNYDGIYFNFADKEKEDTEKEWDIWNPRVHHDPNHDR